MAQRKTLKEWQERSDSVHDNSYTILEWAVNNHTPVKILCKRCQVTFVQSMNSHSQGRGCRVCGNKSRREKMSFSKQDWQDRSDALHGIGRYVILELAESVHAKSRVLCTKCNTEFMQAMKGHGLGKGCNKCAAQVISEKLRFCQGDWQDKSDQVHGDGRYKILKIGTKVTLKSEILCLKCNEAFLQTMRDHAGGCGCQKCANSGISKQEDSLAEALKNLDLDLTIVRSNRDILGDGKELDIVFTDQKVAVEYCGLRWHSEKFKGRTYHHDKYLRALEAGYHLVTVFSDEYLENSEKVVRAISSLLGKSPKGKGARQLEVRKVVRKESKEFFEKYHLQGSAPQTVTFGLYDATTLVSAMTFTHPQRQGAAYEWELRRFATDGRKHAGAASRLFSAFLKEYKPNSVGSMSDNRWFSGGMYKALGFTLDGEVPIDYTYVKGQKRFHKSGFRKSCIKRKLPSVYHKDKTERVMMKEAGYLRIYDCGKKRWIWRKETH